MYIVHCPKEQGLGMAYIGVHCTLHKMAMLKNGTYLCKLQLHVDMGSIIHFCTDTNTQNRTNFTKSLNTRFITESAKTSTFILFKILWTFHHHVSWQASELPFLHRHHWSWVGFSFKYTIIIDSSFQLSWVGFMQNLTNKATSLLRMI